MPTGTGDTSGDSSSADGAETGSDESCGNGVIDPGEACDDGNQESLDGCPADCTVGTGMVHVPGGPFGMGCTSADTDCLPEERPRHDVTLTGFEIDRTEVTVESYRGCVDAGICAPPAAQFSNYALGLDDHPVNCLTWDQADKYCEWAGKRLPTEAEWEKAARGDDERIYPWGNDADDSLAVIGGTFNGTEPVGSRSPGGDSPFGATDMAGNVAEWVLDWFAYDYYEQPGPWVDPQGPDGVQMVGVLRGGSYAAELTLGRASSRGRGIPSLEEETNGVRCARTP